MVTWEVKRTKSDKHNMPDHQCTDATEAKRDMITTLVWNPLFDDGGSSGKAHQEDAVPAHKPSATVQQSKKQRKCHGIVPITDYFERLVHDLPTKSALRS